MKEWNREKRERQEQEENEAGKGGGRGGGVESQDTEGQGGTGMINCAESASTGCVTHDGSFFASLILTIRTVFWYTSRTIEGLAMICHLPATAYTR